MIRKATLQDINSIYELLQIYGDKGEMLARPLSELYDHMRDFSVFEEDGKVTGCCALQICWENLAEIRSLAVAPNHTGQQIGISLVKEKIAEAKSFKIDDLFTLTYQPEFFKKFGFNTIDRSELPLKIWTGCVNCIKFPDCDETALMLKI